MREIKFRFFDKNGKKMYQAGVLDFDDKKVYMAGYMNYSQSNFLLEDVELMQSTGLKDKNGVEIYEGDILEDPYSDDRATVEWSEEDGMFVLIIDDVQTNFSNEKSTCWEVVGNIYDN